MKLPLQRIVTAFLAALWFAPAVWAGTTGKIAGRVTEAGTGEPLIGVQVVIEESVQGAVTDVDGYYTLINIKPGYYTVSFRYIGFATKTYEEVQVIVDKTFTLNVEEEVVQGQEIVVTAERPIVQMDRTTTTAFVEEREIQALPVTNLDEIVELQAGVVDGHFRGGRAGEVMYMYGQRRPHQQPVRQRAGDHDREEHGAGTGSDLRRLQRRVGQAMSGVVNIVTKDAPREWTGEFQAEAGGIASTRKLEFVERTAEPGSDLSIADFRQEFVPYYEAAGGEGHSALTSTAPPGAGPPPCRRPRGYPTA